MTCPICGGRTAPEIRPFCSRRCADVDLARWLTGRYAIPADAATPSDEAADASDGPRDGPEDGPAGPPAAASATSPRKGGGGGRVH